MSIQPTIQEQLRDTVQSLRRSRLTLSDVIPLLLRGADEIDFKEKRIKDLQQELQLLKLSHTQHVQTLEKITEQDWRAHASGRVIYGLHAQAAFRSLGKPIPITSPQTA